MHISKCTSGYTDFHFSVVLGSIENQKTSRRNDRNVTFQNLIEI